jgi:thiamine pyrophosphate-dependent acetolactate synthase large subunit-like protein
VTHVLIARLSVWREMAAPCTLSKRLDSSTREARRHDRHLRKSLLCNPQYRIGRVGVDNPGLKARSLFDLHDPTLDWVKLAEGMGVEAARAETTERFADLFASAMKTRGPRLIEAVI